MINNLRLIGAALAGLATFGFNCGAVIAADESRDERALHAEYPEVVKLQSKTEVCTGTLIGPRAILSAAHCADLKNSFVEYAGQRYRLRYVRSAGYPRREHDVAVAIADRDIDGARIAKIGRGLHHGSVITLAGYGCTRRGGPSGPLHLGRTKVIGMDEDHVLSTQPKGAVLCQGDSGGPAFMKENGHNVVVAVNSAGDIRDINLNVRLDSPASRGFLKAVAEKFKVAICGISRTCGERAGHLIAAR